MTADPADDCSSREQAEATEGASSLEKADVAVAKAVAPYRGTPLVRTLGFVSEIADQPPLIAICSATLGWGLLAGNHRLARAGARMLAAELLATAIKTGIKRSIDRTRPTVLVEDGEYEMAPGSTRGHHITSFPSGHTAGAVTVARALARDYPEHAAAAYGAAAAIAAVQIPRCTHYPTDIAAGAVIGVASEAIVSLAIGAASRLVSSSSEQADLPAS